MRSTNARALAVAALAAGLTVLTVAGASVASAPTPTPSVTPSASPVPSVLPSGDLAAGPFGSIAAHLEERSPWSGYLSEGGYGLTIRAQKIGTRCQEWSRALVSPAMAADHGAVFVSLTIKDAQAAEWQDRWLGTWKHFGPWSRDELQMIRECDQAPCRVKVSHPEGKRMDAAGESGRLVLFRDLVGDRVAHYLKTEERLETEVPGKPIEPWAFLEGKGFKPTALKRPASPSLWVRQFREKKDDEVQIRQVVDLRTAIKADASEAALWIRDIYSDHFFDSWGEFLHVACGADGTGALVQVLFLEVDLLKKTDLLTRIARGKIRSSLEERGRAYQEAELKTLLGIVRGGERPEGGEKLEPAKKAE